MKKILIVNSLQAYLEKERSILHRSTIEIFTATSSTEALAIHERERVDLVLAELELPEMTGDTLCRMLRRNVELKQVAVLLVCYDIKEARERVQRCGANDWIAKPVRPAELLAKVEQFLAVQSRKAFRALVSTTVHGNLDSQKFYSTAQNISTSGILVETDKQLERGTRITCSFYLPGADQFVVEALVVRIIKVPGGKYHYGLQFVNLKREELRGIERFIEQGVR